MTTSRPSPLPCMAGIGEHAVTSVYVRTNLHVYSNEYNVRDAD